MKSILAKTLNALIKALILGLTLLSAKPAWASKANPYGCRGRTFENVSKPDIFVEIFRHDDSFTGDFTVGQQKLQAVPLQAEFLDEDGNPFFVRFTNTEMQVSLDLFVDDAGETSSLNVPPYGQYSVTCFDRP